MKSAVSLLVLAYILMLSNCGFTSDFPITEKPDGEIDEALLRTWYFADTTETVAYYAMQLETIEWSNGEYLVIVKYFKASGELRYLDHFKVHKSKVNEEEYINVIALPAKDRTLICKIKPIDSLSLKINFINDSLKMTFENSEAFYNYIEKNQKEFESYLNEEWIALQRAEYWTWDKSNFKWKDSISVIYQLNQSIKQEVFEQMNIKAGIDSLEYEILDKEQMFAEFNNYYQTLSRSGFWKRKPKCLIFIMQNGEYIKYLWSDFYIEDITHKHAYRRLN